jgi:hypothetical protein
MVMTGVDKLQEGTKVAAHLTDDTGAGAPGGGSPAAGTHKKGSTPTGGKPGSGGSGTHKAS